LRREELGIEFTDWFLFTSASLKPACQKLTEPRAKAEVGRRVHIGWKRTVQAFSGSMAFSPIASCGCLWIANPTDTSRVVMVAVFAVLDGPLEELVAVRTLLGAEPLLLASAFATICLDLLYGR
jgi:hypothetical protein